MFTDHDQMWEKCTVWVRNHKPDEMPDWLETLLEDAFMAGVNARAHQEES
jgi:hypothetical protein